MLPSKFQFHTMLTVQFTRSAEEAGDQETTTHLSYTRSDFTEYVDTEYSLFRVVVHVGSRLNHVQFNDEVTQFGYKLIYVHIVKYIN